MEKRFRSYQESYAVMKAMGYSTENTKPLILAALYSYMQYRPDMNFKRLEDSRPELARVECPVCHDPGNSSFIALDIFETKAEFQCQECRLRFYPVTLAHKKTPNVLAKLQQTVERDFFEKWPKEKDKVQKSVDRKPRNMTELTSRDKVSSTIQKINPRGLIDFYVNSRDDLFGIDECRITDKQLYLDVSPAGSGKTRRSAMFSLERVANWYAKRKFLVVKSATSSFANTPELFHYGWSILPGRAKKCSILRVEWKAYSLGVQYLPDIPEIIDMLEKVNVPFNLDTLDLSCYMFDRIYPLYNMREASADVCARIRNHCSEEQCAKHEVCLLKKIRSELLYASGRTKLVVPLKALKGIVTTPLDIVEFDDCEADELGIISNESAAADQEHQLPIFDIDKLIERALNIMSYYNLSLKLNPLRQIFNRIRFLIGNSLTKKEVIDFKKLFLSSETVKELKDEYMLITETGVQYDKKYLCKLVEDVGVRNRFLNEHDQLIVKDIINSLFSLNSAVIIDNINRTFLYKYLGVSRINCPIFINNANGFSEYYQKVFPKHKIITYQTTDLKRLGISSSYINARRDYRIAQDVSQKIWEDSLPDIELHRLPPVYATNYENLFLTLSTIYSKLNPEEFTIAVYNDLYDLVNDFTFDKAVAILRTKYPSLQRYLLRYEGDEFDFYSAYEGSNHKHRENIIALSLGKVLTNSEGISKKDREIFSKFMDLAQAVYMIGTFPYVFNMHNARGDNQPYLKGIKKLLILGEPIRDIITAKALDGDRFKPEKAFYELPNNQILTCYDSNSSVRRYITAMLDQLAGRLRQTQLTEKTTCYIAGTVSEFPMLPFIRVVDYPAIRLTYFDVKRVAEKLLGSMVQDRDGNIKPLSGRTLLSLTNLLKLLVISLDKSQNMGEDNSEDNTDLKLYCAQSGIDYYHYMDMLNLDIKKAISSKELFSAVMKILADKFSILEEKLIEILEALNLNYLLAAKESYVEALKEIKLWYKSYFLTRYIESSDKHIWNRESLPPPRAA